jgi:hypothetical protein
MSPNPPTPAANTAPATPGPASASLARGDLGARLLRLAQVAAAVHAARAAQPGARA